MLDEKSADHQSHYDSFDHDPDDLSSPPDVVCRSEVYSVLRPGHQPQEFKSSCVGMYMDLKRGSLTCDAVLRCSVLTVEADYLDSV